MQSSPTIDLEQPYDRTKLVFAIVLCSYLCKAEKGDKGVKQTGPDIFTFSIGCIHFWTTIQRGPQKVAI